MSYIDQNYPRSSSSSGKKRFYKKTWFKIVAPIVVVLILAGGVFAWKANSILSRVSKSGLLSAVVHNIPGVDNQLKGEKDGRINILLLGMRGANDPAGGTLADTIMVLSVEPQADKASLISVPRDLFVDNPATGSKTKLNAVYAYGEKKGAGQGMTYMEQAMSTITGVPIDYSVVINFDGFKKIIDILGGVKVTLDKPFEESVQFNQPHVCDGITFTVPTGEYENKTAKVYWPGTKTVKRERIVKSYPLCTNAHPECNGDFKLSAGEHTLNSDQALCYARSRETSNDFARAKRQQQVLKAVKNELLSAGTLTNFSKINDLMNNLGDNLKTDMQSWELQRAFTLYQGMNKPELYQRVIDATDDNEVGLVYGKKDDVAGDILLPKGDNYDRIHALFQNIFNLSPTDNGHSTADFSTSDNSSSASSDTSSSTSNTSSTASNSGTSSGSSN